MAKILQLQAESSIVSIPLSLAMYCENCNTISNSRPHRCGVCGSSAVLFVEPILNPDPDPANRATGRCGSLTCARSAPNYCAPAVIQKDAEALPQQGEAI
jgi:hypothetical protein